jgi:hypothetical protein
MFTADNRWKLRSWKTKRLIVGEVQMQNVELAQSHTVDGASQTVHADKVARHVNEYTAPGKPRLIIYFATRNLTKRDLGVPNFGTCCLAPANDQLNERGQGMQHAPLALRTHDHPIISNRHLISLGVSQLRKFRARGGADYLQTPRYSVAFGDGQADALQSRLKTLDRTIQAVAARGGEFDLQVTATAKRPSTSLDSGWVRQECGVEDGGG